MSKRTARGRHATGLTLLTTAAVAVIASLLPLPDALRPFPKLREGSVAELRTALLPPRTEAGLRRAWATVTHAPTAPLAPAPPETAEPSPAAVATELAHPGEDRRDLALRLLGAADRADALELEAWREKLGARSVPIEQGCRRKANAGFCAERALAPFFREVDGLLSGAGRRPVRVVHLGDSLIASDHITDVLRSRLQARYGSGGPGFLFVDRPTRAGRGVRAGVASEGWEISRITDRGGPARPTGFSGVTFASASPQRVEYATAGARYAELFFRTDPRGGDLQLKVDGVPSGRILTRFPKAEPAFARTRVPAGARTLTLLARGAVQLYGVSFEAGGPGIVYDSIGIPGATAKLLLRNDDQLFRDQLAHRDPALVVVMLGGNEAFELSRGESTADEVRDSFQQLVQRLRDAVPDAACLLTSPMDAATRKIDGSLVPRAGSAEIASVIREVALASGCAYWDMLEAMGGVGSVPRWLAAGAMNEDLVHPRARGADLIGHLADLALADAQLEWKGGAALQDPPGLEDPDALRELLARLRALSAGKRDRVAILQLGASHTASHLFTDVVRERLAEKFGAAGRGFVAAGKTSKRLDHSGTSRALEGSWEIPDATARTARNQWGLTGIRAEGAAGSTAAFNFCEACAGEARSRLQLHFLEEPQMGRLELRVDGEKVASYPEPGEPVRRRGAKVIELEVPGERHQLQILNRGPGPLSLFGAAHELVQPGVVLDALGLPGSTIFTLAGYDQAALAEQLKARRPDAFFLFYGTNESALAEVDLRQMRARYDKVFQTLHSVAPAASCLLIGPTDRQEQGPNGVWIEARSQRRVIPALREVARAHGCAFWSARAEMGGPGAISRWLERTPPLAHPDHVHLSVEGYQVLANAFVDDLLGAYAAGSGGER